MAHLCTNLHPSWPSAILPPQISFSSFFFMHRVKVNPNMGIVKLSTTITGAISRGSNGDGVVEGKVVKSVAKTDKKFVHEGSITESLPNGMFRVLLDNEQQILGYLSGKIRKNFVRVLPGDRVRVELSPYDLTKGRIVYRIRNREASG